MFALALKEDNRIQYATEVKYAFEGMPIVNSLPDGDITDYLYINGNYIYTPEPVPEPVPEEPTWQERMEAQILYTALMTDTLVEE